MRNWKAEILTQDDLGDGGSLTETKGLRVGRRWKVEKVRLAD